MTSILYCPRAHNKHCLDEAVAWIRSHGEDPENLVSVFDIPDLASYVAAMTEEDKIILIGGDGTFMRFADAIRDIDLRVPVFFTASGTGNDFLRDLPEAQGQDPVPVNRYITDLPRVYVQGEEHVFLNGIGYGLDGFCCEEADRKQAKSDKPVNYSAIAISGIFGKFKSRNAEITVDGVTKTYRRIWLAPTMNGRYYGGGLKIAPAQERLNDTGKVSSVAISGHGRLYLFTHFPKIKSGKHTGLPIVEIREGDEVTVRFDRPCALQIDGETYLGVTEYTVRSRGALKRARETAKSGAEAKV